MQRAHAVSWTQSKAMPTFAFSVIEICTKALNLCPIAMIIFDISHYGSCWAFFVPKFAPMCHCLIVPPPLHSLAHQMAYINNPASPIWILAWPMHMSTTKRRWQHHKPMPNETYELTTILRHASFRRWNARLCQAINTKRTRWNARRCQAYNTERSERIFALA